MATSALSTPASIGTQPNAHAGADPDAPRSGRVGRARSLGRRPSLPTGRAAIGGVLITLAALGSFVAATSANTGPTASIVVSDRPLTAGDRIDAADLHVIAVDLPDDALATFFDTTSSVGGATVLAAVDAHQPVPRASVSTATADARPPAHDLSFSLERDRALNGRLRPGERIDLVATFGSGAEASTEIVTQDVEVIEIDRGSGSSGSSAKVALTVSLPDEATVLRTTHAIAVAQVTIVRSTGAARDRSAEESSATSPEPDSSSRPTGTTDPAPRDAP